MRTLAVMNVNPTRMELTRLKKKLKTAVRGHKLLKDKRDELMRQFLDIIRENKELRVKVEESLTTANKSLVMAKSLMQSEVFKTALLMPKQQVSLSVTEKNVMSVEIPVFDAVKKTNDPYDIFYYGFSSTSAELDDGILTLSKTLPDILKLAQQENAAQLMASEIEKTRRRVNALEHVMIPNYQDTIRYITMKLDENERSSQTRLMKVKDMMVKEAIEEKQSQMN